MKPLVWVLALALLGCSGEPVTAGLEEPLRVAGAQFFDGDLPGLPPLTADDLNAGAMPQAPNVSGLTLNNGIIAPGEAGRTISGSATKESLAVGVRFADLGTGYWLVPTGSPDDADGLEWRFRAAFGRRLPPGKHQLLLASVDSQGRSGTQVAVNLCLLPEVPDNGSACIPDTAPPALVVSLAWDARVDLDLRVVTPTGKVVDPKHPTTTDPDENGKVAASAGNSGTLDHDAFASCSASDGRGGENLVFQTTPPAGTYLVYASLFDACGAAGVTFDVSLHAPSVGDDGALHQVETYRQSAQLSAAQADGGAELGTFITSFVVE